MTRAVIFDLYGTLLHLVQNSQPYLRLFEALEFRSMIEGVQRAFTSDAADLSAFSRQQGKEPPPEVAQWEQALAADLQSAELFADTLPALRMLRDRGLRIGVISNLTAPYKRPLYDLGLDELTDAVVFSCDLRVAKPDERIYIAALEQLEVASDKVLMVGDSLRSDVHGPAAVGIRGLLLDRSDTSDHQPRITTLEELVIHV